MKVSKLLLAGVLSLSANLVSASTILSATDGDVNFLFTPLPAGVTLYMFNDDDNNSFAAAGNSLLVPIPSVVGISGPQSGDYLASNSGGNLTLTNAPDFVLAVYDTNISAWVGDSNPVFYGNGNAAQLTFDLSGGVLVVDVQPIPVPAAVWLFGSGLIGLAGVARRRA